MKSFEHLIMIFENYLKSLGFAKKTVRSRLSALKDFVSFIRREDEKMSAADISESDIKDYAAYLKKRELQYKRALAPSTINHKLYGLNLFFRFLHRNEMIINNPMEDFVSWIKEIPNIREIFTKEEITLFLDSIETATAKGMRDRAVFELIYSSGLRISEVIKLNLSDLDLSERTLLVRLGKGGKDRVVPFSVVSSLFLDKYIKESRNFFIKPGRYEIEDAVFLTEHGRISASTIYRSFKRGVEDSGIIRKKLTVHSIRHTTATHLLESGANVRYVQELLGHESIETTVKYTHLVIDNLKRAYKSAHPRENEYFEEVDDEYLDRILKLKDEIIKENRKYRRI